MSRPVLPRLLLTLAALTTLPLAYGQADTRAWEDRPTTDRAIPLARPGSRLEGRLFATANVLGYAHNIEYFGDHRNAYTLLGAVAAPRVLFALDTHITLIAGLIARHEWGWPGPRPLELRPTLSLRWRPNRHHQVIVGAIDGHAAHRLPEPLLDPERVITRRQEEGLQWQVQTPRLFLDTWVDWQRAIRPFTQGQEQFEAGVSAWPLFAGPRSAVNQGTVEHRESVRIEAPIHLLFNHRGGQLDTTRLRSGAVTNAALMAGLRLSLFGNRPCETCQPGLPGPGQDSRSPVGPGSGPGDEVALWIEGYLVATRHLGDDRVAPQIDTRWQRLEGAGYYTTVAARYRGLVLSLSHGAGTGLFMPQGAPMWQARGSNLNYPRLEDTQRRAIMMPRLAFERPLSSVVSLSARADVTFVQGQRRAPFSATLLMHLLLE